MKLKKLIFLLVYFVIRQDFALAENTTLPTPTHLPSLELSGKLAIGTGAIHATAYNENDTYKPFINSLSIRYWASDLIALELLGGFSNTSSASMDFLGNPAKNYNQMVGGGIELKANIVHPVRDFFVQLVFSGSYAVEDAKYYYSFETYSFHREFWGTFTGLGFEYFLPFLESLSIEASVGLLGTIDNTKTEDVYGPPSVPSVWRDDQTTLHGAISTIGLNLNTISVHYYF